MIPMVVVVVAAAAAVATMMIILSTVQIVLLHYSTFLISFSSTYTPLFIRIAIYH
jgi:hypothetical protein